MVKHGVESVVAVWQPYIETIADWQQLVQGVEPKPTGCGPVYELKSPLPERGDESFAIADMRDVFVAEPHFHPNGETEIYFVLSGIGNVVVGGKENKVRPGSVVITPPDTTHFTIPEQGLVLAVVNTPSFDPANYVPVGEAGAPGFDKAQLARLVKEAYQRQGLETEHVTDKPGTVYDPHSHEQTRLYTLAGTLDIIVGNDQSAQTLKPFQEFVVGADEQHEGRVGADGWEYVAAWDSEEAKRYEH